MMMVSPASEFREIILLAAALSMMSLAMIVEAEVDRDTVREEPPACRELSWTVEMESVERRVLISCPDPSEPEA